jgi:dihydrofolate reductase
MNRKYNIIVAKSENNVIGNNNSLLWYIPEDLKYFKNITKNNIVVMGRKTFESIGKPLSNRINIVLSRKYELYDISKEYNNLYFVDSFDALFKFINSFKNNKEIFIIGGSMIYDYFIKNELYDKIYMTQLKNIFTGDTYFPNIEITTHNKKIIASGRHNDLIYDFELYTKKSNF